MRCIWRAIGLMCASIYLICLSSIVLSKKCLTPIKPERKNQFLHGKINHNQCSFYTFYQCEFVIYLLSIFQSLCTVMLTPCINSISIDVSCSISTNTSCQLHAIIVLVVIKVICICWNKDENNFVCVSILYCHNRANCQMHLGTLCRYYCYYCYQHQIQSSGVSSIWHIIWVKKSSMETV